MRVKICGVTRVEDACLAAELGAWAVGFVFWPGSPRCIDADWARAIATALPEHVQRVGVFADQPLAHVQATAARAGLDLVQLHGGETPAFARALARPVIKALSLARAADADLQAWEGALVLIDGRDPARLEAGGRTVDWEAAARVAALRPVVLAGGLRPENVGDAVRTVQPHAVDVSSGIERAPGEKDPVLMRAFFGAASAAAQEWRR